MVKPKIKYPTTKQKTINEIIKDIGETVEKLEEMERNGEL